MTAGIYLYRIRLLLILNFYKIESVYNRFNKKNFYDQIKICFFKYWSFGIVIPKYHYQNDLILNCRLLHTTTMIKI